MRRLYNILPGLAMVLTVLSFQACFDEDMSDCPSDMRIYFDYTRSTYASVKEGINPDDVDLLNLYIFSEDGILYDVYEDSNPKLDQEDYHMTIPALPAGLYQLVVWGGLKDDYTLNLELVPGLSTIENLQVYLNCINTYTHTVTKEITPLFFANRGDLIEVLSSSVDLEARLSLIQNTYKVNVTINGVDIDNNYQLAIEDDIAMFDFDNSGFSVGNFNYITPCTKFGDEFYGSLTLLRLMDNRKPVLRLTDVNQSVPIFERDLVEMILLIRTVGGKVDFTYMHEFDIELTYDGFEVEITINGWKIKKEGGDLEV